MNFDIFGLFHLFMKYDVSCEIVMLSLSFIVCLLMKITKPSETRMFKIVKAGIIISMITIVVHLYLLHLTCDINTFNEIIFYGTYIVFSALYITLLTLITIYINLLSYSRRQRIFEMVFTEVFLIVVYFVILLYPVFKRCLYEIDENAIIQFSRKSSLIELCGVICLFVNMLNGFLIRKSVSKIVFLGMCIFIPMELVVLFLQYEIPFVYLLSFSYVMPFVIFYCIFHCSKYDDIIGCQNMDAIYTRISKAIKTNKKYVVIYVTFPQMKKREYSGLYELIYYASSSICREIEGLKRDARIYAENIYTYALFSYVDNDAEVEFISRRVREIIEEPIIHNRRIYKAFYKQIVLTSNENLKKATDVFSMIFWLSNRFNDEFEYEHIIASPKDYEDFGVYNKVEQAVLDIRSEGDLNDERILCYVQPIHCIKTNTFRTGEALMRLKLDDEIIPPDLFIYVAELNNCIHNLTLIILNKVCKKIKEFEDAGYDFDAITVNCSTIEISDKNFHYEIMEIVKLNMINPRHIRLEITESTSIKNYDNILYNMKMLKSHGISFYLDDFGTGYSNLERIASYPFQTIKFDKSILYSAMENQGADNLIRTLVCFFKNNGLNTVVEGVKNEEMYVYCKEIGFDYIQGFLFSRPIPIEDVSTFFSRK